MTRRGWWAAGVAGLMLLGCARPGAETGDGSTEPLRPAPAVALPTAGTAACFDLRASVAASAAVSVAASGRPGGTGAVPPAGDGPGAQFERNRQANNAFRERRELPAIYYAAAQPCVDKVREKLTVLTAKKKFDVASVEAALRAAGLSEAYARPPGRLDLGSHTGVVFSASPGAGCIVGHHGPDDTTVEFGGMVADGGCLVAPD
jgi:hypothetical protein